MSRPTRICLLVGSLLCACIGVSSADDKGSSPALVDDQEQEKQSDPPVVDLRERLARLSEGQIRIQPVPRDLTLAASDDSGEGALFRSFGVAMFAASAGDLVTTELGLARGHIEGNPIARSRGLRYSHHVAGPAAVWYTSRKLHRSGRTKLALLLRISLVAAYGYASIHNAHRIR